MLGSDPSWSPRAIGIILLAAALLPAGVHAEDEVVVSGEAVVEVIATADAEEAPSSALDVITSEDMEASGARSAADALRLVPGVTVEQGARGETTLQVRGFSHRQVQVLLDGVPLSNPYDGGLDLAAISTAQLDEIRVGRGAAGSAYGGGALGGVIDIVTRGPPEDPTFRVRAGGGSWQHGELLAAGGGAVGPVRVSLGWELRNRPWFRLPSTFPAQVNEGGGRRQNSDRRDMVLHGAIGVGNPLHSLTLRTTVMDVRRGVPPHISEPGPRHWRWDLWRDHLISLHGRTQLDGRAALRGAAFVRLRKDVLDSYDDDTLSTQDAMTSFTSAYQDTTGGGMVELDVDLGKGSLLETVLSCRHDLHRSQADLGEEWATRHGDSATFAPVATVRLARPLMGEVGIDMHLWRPRDDAAAKQRSPVFSADPRIGLVARPVEVFSVRASGGRRSRFPTLKEMYSEQFGFVVPSPDLAPEHAWFIDGGLGITPFEERLTVGATGYVAFVDDLIERTIDEQGLRSYTNVSDSRHAGIEVRVVGRPHPRLEIELGYDWLHARDTSEDRVNDLLEYRPEHRARARLHYEAPFGLEISATWTLVGRRHFVDVEATGAMASLPPYSRLDLGLRQRLGRGFYLYAHGRNLYDTLYEEQEGYPQPGFEILGGIEFSGTAPGEEPPGKIRIGG